MKFYSTKNRAANVSLHDAVLQGLAPDGGLYMPETIQSLPSSFFDNIQHRSFQDIAFGIAGHLIGEDIPADELRKITEHTIQFDAPLVEVEKNIWSLELFHGPTLAFKDFGARFLSGLLGYFANRQENEITILAATSGDTGSAVANGFLNVPGIRVVVLYPSGKVSAIQEKQFTTLGGNITALEVSGTFDDCQHLVKQAFLDEDLRKTLTLASANSINIGRLIPQTFYYFYSWSRLGCDSNIIFSVPSGNFGNLTAGIMARKMGMPIRKFIAATNRNDIVPEYINSGKFYPKPSFETISNAMDVGNPSNFARLVDLYGGDRQALVKDIAGYSFSDDETKHGMKQLHALGYTADPHGAVGYLGLKKYIRGQHTPTGPCVFLETAHPGKFRDVVESAIDAPIMLPPRLEAFMKASKLSVPMENDFLSFKDWLTSALG